MKYINKKNILDVGCGVGKICFYLNNYSKKTTGIDISTKAIKIANEIAKRRKEKHISFYSKEIGTEGKFDFIICTEVIEHIKNDSKFLKVIRRNLNDNGALFLTTPTKENLLYKLGFYEEFDVAVGHVRRYTCENLKKLLEENGFALVEMRSVEGPLRNILFTTKAGILIKFIRGPLVEIFHFFDRISAILFGAADIQVLAIKKK